MNRHRRGDAEHLKDASEHLAVLDAHLQRGSLDDVLISDAVSERCLAASTGCEARSAGPSTGSGREVSRR